MQELSEDVKMKLNEQLLKVVLDEKTSFRLKFNKAEYCIQLGADVNARLYGGSILSWVKESGDEKVISYLEEKGQKIGKLG